jgi:peptide/nickel transport system substrate-binding protein
LWFDSVGTGGAQPLLDPKVRRALMLAINRKNIARIVDGKQALLQPQNLCWKDRVIACDYTVSVPDYDPAKAKQLLAEAGYANGFPLKITSYVGRLSLLAEAVAGELAKVGVQATVEPATLTVFAKKSQAGQLQAVVAGHGLDGVPDVSELFDFLFKSNDITKDDTLMKLGDQMDHELDPVKRKQYAAKVFDRVIEQSYIVPLTSQPHFFTHTAEITVAKDSSNGYGIDISRVHWAGKASQ